MKREIQFKVINAVLKYELKCGHLKWKLTDIARISKVHRSLIYYHFGKTKKEIFNSSLEIITGEFYGTSPNRMKYVERGDLYGCVAENFRFFREYPDFIHFYNLTRGKKSPIQEKLIEIENSYQNKLRTLFPHLDNHEILALHSTIHGAVGSLILNEKSFETVFKSMIWPFISQRSNTHQLK